MNELLTKFATLSLKGLLAAGAVAGALYFFLYYDNGAALIKNSQELDDQITQEQAKGLETEKNIKKLQVEKENLKKMEDSFVALQGSVTQSLQMTDVIKWVDSKTAGSAVSLKGKEPKSVIKTEFLEELPIHLTLDGKFSDITLYLFNLMSSKDMLAKISSINLVKDAASNYQPSGVKLAADIYISSYRMLPSVPDVKNPDSKNPEVPK